MIVKPTTCIKSKLCNRVLWATSCILYRVFRDINIPFLLVAAQLRLCPSPRMSWQRAPVILSHTMAHILVYGQYGMLGRQTWRESCQASGEGEAEREMIHSKWDETEKSLICYHYHIEIPSRQSPRDIFILLIHQIRKEREGGKNKHHQWTKIFWYFKARGAFSSPLHAN